MPYLIPALFLLGTLVIGLWRSRSGSSDEYLLMNRTLGAPALIVSLVCGWYGGILGISEYSYKYGLSNWFVFGVPYYLHALIFAIFFAARARNSRLFSIPDRIELAYGRNAARTAAIIIFLTTMPAAYLVMVGKTVQWIFGWNYPVSLIVATLFSTVYAYSGGLRSVIRTDIPQFIFMYGGFAILLYTLYSQFGGLAFLHASVPPELFTPTGGQPFAAVFVWYIIASTTLIEPLFYERSYAAKSHRILLPSILIAIVWWAIFDFMSTATGLYARALLPQLADPTFAFPELAKQVLPPALFGVFLAALLAVVMSTIDAYVFLAAAALGRDYFWRSQEQPAPDSQNRYVAGGMIAATFTAFFLALVNESIISIWHAVGSIAAPALLVPTISAWFPKWRANPKWVTPSMLSCAIVSLLWTLAPLFLASDTYPFQIEPIYVGLALAIILHLAGRRLLVPSPD